MNLLTPNKPIETTPKSTSVAVCVATYKRPDALNRLAKSLLRQKLPESTEAELRIVDNDIDQSAKEIVESLSHRRHPFSKIIYVNEPAQNIALARNAAIELGPVDFLAFVDDDEIVAKDWLKNLMQTQGESGADAVFGPVYALFDKRPPLWIASGGFFNKLVPDQGDQLDWKQTRTSNTLVRGSYFYSSNPLRFESAYGRSGGSDSALFAEMQQQGAIFAPCRDALAWESVSTRRSKLLWLLKRHYRCGLIYERIAREKIEDIHPLNRVFRRLGGCILLLFGSVKSNNRPWRVRAAQSLFKLALATGGAIGWLRPQAALKHVAYKTKSEAKSVNRRKVAFLTNIVSPYRAPVFKKLSNDPDIALRVIIDARTEFDREWQVDTKGLDVEKTFSLSWKRSIRYTRPIRFKQTVTLHLPIGLLFSLIKYRPDIVISHELGFRTLIATLYCSIFRKPLVIWAYQSRVTSQQAPWRQRVRRFMLKRANAVIGMGTQAREVLRNWNVPDRNIYDALNAANHESIENQLSSPLANERIQKIKETYSRGRKLAIVVGRLIPVKGIEYLLDAWDRLDPKVKDEWTLLFVGNGPLAPYVSNRDPRIQLVEGVESDAIAYWFAAADLHLFPSIGDVWGLVVNEASHCGTPTVCSPLAGCADDLIIEGHTGLIADFTDPEQGLSKLERALARKSYIEMGINARKRVQRFSIENLSQSFASAAKRFA